MSVFTVTTPKGHEVTVCDGVMPTAAELSVIDDFIESDEPELDTWEDPDSDGYGWERKALRGVW